MLEPGDWRPEFALGLVKMKELFELDRAGMFDPRYHPSPLEIAERAEQIRIEVEQGKLDDPEQEMASWLGTYGEDDCEDY